jgi:hypothetical protein
MAGVADQLKDLSDKLTLMMSRLEAQDEKLSRVARGGTVNLRTLPDKYLFKTAEWDSDYFSTDLQVVEVLRRIKEDVTKNMKTQTGGPDRDAHEVESLLKLLKGLLVDHGSSGHSQPRGSGGEAIVDITKRLILLREKAEHGLESFRILEKRLETKAYDDDVADALKELRSRQSQAALYRLGHGGSVDDGDVPAFRRAGAKKTTASSK